MNERIEKLRRRNQKLKYICAFDKWLSVEPPIVLFWQWRKWKNARPKIGDFT